ncbi:Scr1 family TA system antitoxin-like transcriptional regulator [Streptodolium elevatio]|uniref:Scr1 family TA system antitoxin-like transcriptional regulator n=1 Tax=Streptodolium elevatio TaxID=3157996 RepID=A0ABV3DMY8_9ACTN
MARLPNVSLGVIASSEGFYACMHGTFTLRSFEDASEVCYLVAADASRISTDHHKIATFRDAYDGLQSAALSQRLSEELIREVLESP